MARILGAITAFGLLLLSGSAWALDAEGLRRAVTDDLTARFALFPDLRASYDVAVNPAGDGFAVAVKDLSLSDQAGSFQVDFGTWSFDVRDLGSNLYQVSNFAAPGVVTLDDGGGSTTKVASYRLERLDGRWSSDMSNFLDMDMVLSDFKAGLESVGALFTLDRVTGQVTGQIKAGNQVDQQATARGVGLRASVDGGGGIQASEIFLEYNVADMDLTAGAAYMEFAREMAALQDESLDNETKQRIAAKAFDGLSSAKILPDSFGERLVVSEVAVFDHLRQKQGGVDALEFTLGANGLRGAAADGKLGTKLTNLAFTPPAVFTGATWLQVVPRNLSFVLAVEQVPVEPLWQAFFRTSAQQMLTQDEDTRDLAMAALGFELMATLTMAGTRLSLPHLAIDTPSAGLNADGILEADGEAALGAKGALTVSATGLDDLLALGSSATTPEEQQAMGVLFMLKSQARRETDADGRPVDIWALELMPTGQVLLNGAPFGLPPMQQ